MMNRGSLTSQAPVESTLRARWSAAKIWVELTRNLAVRDVQTRYKHSVLGLYWAVINPLLTAVIFTFIFQVIFHATSKPVPYVVFVVGNLTFWNYFANSLSSATLSITGSSALLAKIYFPRVVLPTASVVARLIDFAFSSLVLGLFVIIFHVHLRWTALFVLPVLVLQTLFTLGLSYLVSALNVLLRDMAQIIGLALMIWMYISPVMYPITGQPKSIQMLLLMNPMGALIQSYQDLMYTGHLTHPATLWTAGAWCIFVFVAGLAAFKTVEPMFAEVM